MRDSIVSDATEALLGAIYLDGGFERAREFVLKFILNDIERKQLFYDSKTILQELVQEDGKQPVEYVLTGESGPDHNKQFEVEDQRYSCRKRRRTYEKSRRTGCSLPGAPENQTVKVKYVFKKHRGTRIQILCQQNNLSVPQCPVR